MKSITEQFDLQGFYTMPYPDGLRGRVVATTGAWERFCALPLGDKQIGYSSTGAGVGYEYKDGTGPKGDHKENLDISLGGLSWLSDQTQDARSEVREFVANASGLIQAIKPAIVGFAKNLSEELDLPGFEEEVIASDGGYFIRFIHYFGNRQSDDEIAVAHTDQSGFTLHLYESAGGLQALTRDMEWIDMPVDAGNTAIIPSMQLQLRAHGRLKATCHRVVATSETARTGRYSAVCFVQLARTAKYNKTRHGRLQEKPPGFNYGMTHEEFAKLFCDQS